MVSEVLFGGIRKKWERAQGRFLKNVERRSRKLERRKSFQEVRRREWVTFLGSRHLLVGFCLEIVVTRGIWFSPGP